MAQPLTIDAFASAPEPAAEAAYLVSPQSVGKSAPAENFTDAFLPGAWFHQFHQDYGDGVRVTKRGLEASALVVRKYNIGVDEVLALSTYDGRRRAITAFHFHPDFKAARRRHYMEAHREGYDVALEVTQHMDALKANRQSAIMQRFTKIGHAVGAAANAVAVFLLAHYSSGR